MVATGISVTVTVLEIGTGSATTIEILLAFPASGSYIDTIVVSTAPALLLTDIFCPTQSPKRDLVV